MYLPAYTAGHVTICPDQTQLVATLTEVRPHGFFGVPRVWETFAARMDQAVSGLDGDRRTAVDRARERYTDEINTLYPANTTR